MGKPRLPDVEKQEMLDLPMLLLTLLLTALDGEDFFGRGALPPDPILVIGSEGRGISPAVAACATHRYRLPMAGGAESLNAAVAAGIMIYDLYRVQRQGES